MSAKKYLLLSLASLSAKDFDSAAALFFRASQEPDLSDIISALSGPSGFDKPRKDLSDQDNLTADFDNGKAVQTFRDRPDDTNPESGDLSSMGSASMVINGRRFSRQSIISKIGTMFSQSEFHDPEEQEKTRELNDQYEQDQNDPAHKVVVRAADTISDFNSDVELDSDSDAIIVDSDENSDTNLGTSTSAAAISDTDSESETQGTISDHPAFEPDPDLPGVQRIPTSFSSDVG